MPAVAKEKQLADAIKSDAAEEMRQRVRETWKKQIENFVFAHLGRPHDLLCVNVGLWKCGTRCRVDVWRRLPPTPQTKSGICQPDHGETLLYSNKLSDSFFLRLASAGDNLKLLSVDPKIELKY